MLLPEKKRLDAFDENKFIDVLFEELQKMPDYEAIMIYSFLKHCRNKVDFWYLKMYLEDPKTWRMPMVSVDTFLDSDFYLGESLNQGTAVYPAVRKIVRDVIEGGYQEGVEVAGIGSGKSYSASILSCYMVMHLLCLRKPHSYYKLTKDKAIAIMNMGTTATQALEVVFTGINTFITKSKFFQQLNPDIKSGLITFKKEMIMMVSGNSKATTPLGYNVFCAVLDEAAFYLDNDEKSAAQEIYQSIQGRIVSRFGTNGLVMMISSPRYPDDFIMEKYREAQKLNDKGEKINDRTYSILMPSWKVKDPALFIGPKKKPHFYFHCKLNIILSIPLADIERLYKVNYLEDPLFDDTYDVWEIPNDYISSFSANPERSKRDFGAIPTEAISGFFPAPEIVSEAFNRDRPDVVVSPGQYSFPDRPLRTSYYIHLDLGLNKDGKGDHTGFSMGHFDGWQKDEVSGETRMKFKMDVIERIGIEGRKGQVDLGAVRQRIYDLKAKGYNIALVTLDGFASQDFIQILKKKGFRCEYQSVDRTIDAYNTLKEAIYEKRIDMYYNETLEKELVRLELIRGKIDHPTGGSKDVSDSVAGTVFNIFSNTPYSDFGMRVVGSFDPFKGDENLRIHNERKQAEKAIERKMRIVERRDEIANKYGLY